MELAIVLLMLLIIVAVGALKLNEPSLGFPFKRKTNLFTPVECTFLKLLEEAVGQHYRIVCRVKLNDVIALRQATDKKAAKAAMTRASGKQLDFVLCSKDDMSPVVALDLVQPQGYKAQRDWFVSGSLDAARVPYVRIKIKSGYKPQDIRECIESKLRVYYSQSNIPKQEPAHAPVMNKRPTRPLRSMRQTSPEAA